MLLPSRKAVNGADQDDASASHDSGN